MIAAAAIVGPGGIVEVACLTMTDQEWPAELFYILNA